MNDLIGDYYEVSTPQAEAAYQRGEIHWVPSLYLERDLKLVRPVGPDPWAGDVEGWEMIEASQPDLHPPPFDHPPLRSPPLESREEHLALKAKLRPSILFSSAPEQWCYRSGDVRESVYLVLPMFSFHEEDRDEFRLRVRALAYRELFYLPEDNRLRMIEGFVRFDRAHVVPRGWMKPHSVRLSDDAMLMLEEWFVFYLTGTASDWLLEYRAELGAALDDLLARMS